MFSTILLIGWASTEDAFAATTLKVGSRGNEVYWYQRNLGGLGFDCGEPDSKFGSRTKQATIEFQRRYGLQIDGIAGTITLRKVNEEVVDVQNDLQLLGYTQVTKDGLWGDISVAALKDFQSKYHLPVTGVADATTRETLKKAVQECTSGYASEGKSNIKTYSLKQDGNKKITNNFAIREFASKDGSDTILIDVKLAELLQNIREHFGKPVIINSAYRSKEHNKKVGGASNSYHLYGQAADIQIKGVSPREIAKYAESLGVKGIGLYGTFVHVDTRTTKYYWNSAGQAVNTFY